MKKQALYSTLFFLFLFVIIAHADEKNTVYIYDDVGAGKNSVKHALHTLQALLPNHYHVQKIKAAEITEGKLQKNGVLLLMPGADSDWGYVKKLKGKPNEKIRQFVRHGGIYVGICAGAYYASHLIDFDSPPILIHQTRELNLFHGRSVGPALAHYSYLSEEGSRAAHIDTVFKTVPHVVTYYNGGGYFADLEKSTHTRVIATYTEIHKPAIILIHEGKGQVLLSGIHFEHDPEIMNSDDEFSQKIQPELVRGNLSRKKLDNALLHLLGIN